MLSEILEIVAAPRYDKQKPSAINRINRALAEVGQYEEPSRWEKIKTMWIRWCLGIFSTGNRKQTDMETVPGGRSFTENDLES
jgi:hypothetical protein